MLDGCNPRLAARLGLDNESASPLALVQHHPPLALIDGYGALRLEESSA